MNTSEDLSGTERDLGGFIVRRLLPDTKLRTLGPFIFFDYFGPMAFPVGNGLDVRPHPHIGLCTVTYLFAGRVDHRDSLGSVQTIEPGAVNWMVAGRGVAHSERTPESERARGAPLHGIQSWVAIPQGQEECAPSFSHHPAESLPCLDTDGIWLRLILGTGFGLRSPVPTFGPILYAELKIPAGGRFSIPAEHEERGVLLIAGALKAQEQALAIGHLHTFATGKSVMLSAEVPSRLMIVGGARLSTHHHVWWNFASTSRERIEQAKSDWKAGRFARVPGDSEFIPLPESHP